MPPARTVPPSKLQRRRHPRQPRAQVSAESILAAAGQLLEKGGYAALTTNHIAARAGVSIGTLYQYFPNKESICRELAERHFQRHAKRYLEHLAEVDALAPEAQVRAMVRVSCQVAREDPSVAKNLYAEISRIGGLDPMLRMREAIEAAMTRRFLAMPAAFRPPNPALAAFVTTVACSSVVADAVLRRPDWLAGDELIEEVSALILGYYERLQRSVR